MKWSQQRVTVTGACGFIGSHLVEQVTRMGAETKALVYYNARGSNGWMDDVTSDIRQEIQVVQGDIRDTEQMRNLIADSDVVFHLAALIGIPYSYYAPRSYIDTNVTGTLNILEAARQAHVRRVIVLSTSEVYGTALRVPIDEGHPLQAQSPYSASKIAAEKLSESFHKSFDVPIVVVRPFNTFGPRQSARAVIPTILMQLLKGCNELELGDPTTTRDFNYVEDTVTGLLRIAECDRAVGRVVNIGTGVEVSIGEIAERAQRILGCKAAIRTHPSRIRPPGSEVRRLCADHALLKELTGWAPSARIEEGLLRTAEWMKKDLKNYDSKRYYI